MRFPNWLRQHPGKTAIVLVSVALAVWMAFLYQDAESREAMIAFGRELPAVWFVVLFLILPLAGFPIKIFLLLAGFRFGFGGGMAVAAAAVLFHNFAAYRLAHGLFRARMRDYLERSGYAIPPIKTKHRSKFTALFAAIPGPPYVAKLYLLAVTDVPFRTYFCLGAPIYILGAAIPVGLGSAVLEFNATWFYLIIGAVVILPLAGYWLRRRGRIDLRSKTETTD
jgi:uncharacterized membrane protein YdjX (TVP38/TMEM64 family)